MHFATEQDVPNINRILNDPTIRPYMAPGENALDATGKTDKMVFMVNDLSVFLAESMGDGEYLGLAAVLPEGRGIGSVIAFRKALDMMFAELDAFRILATVEPDNKRSLRFLKSVGFKTFMPGCQRIHAEIDFTQWALASPACLEMGRRFINIIGEPLYEGEMRMLGAFALTVQRSHGRFTGKAFRFFNRFAKLSQLEYLAPIDENWAEFIYVGKRFKITHNRLIGV